MLKVVYDSEIGDLVSNTCLFQRIQERKTNGDMNSFMFTALMTRDLKMRYEQVYKG